MPQQSKPFDAPWIRPSTLRAGPCTDRNASSGKGPERSGHSCSFSPRGAKVAEVRSPNKLAVGLPEPAERFQPPHPRSVRLLKPPIHDQLQAPVGMTVAIRNLGPHGFLQPRQASREPEKEQHGGATPRPSQHGRQSWSARSSQASPDPAVRKAVPQKCFGNAPSASVEVQGCRLRVVRGIATLLELVSWKTSQSTCRRLSHIESQSRSLKVRLPTADPYEVFRKNSR